MMDFQGKGQILTKELVKQIELILFAHNNDASELVGILLDIQAIIPRQYIPEEVAYYLAGGIQEDRAIRLIQFGGASGKVASADILDTPYTYEDLENAGVGVGSGAILVVDERTSVIDFLQATQAFFSHESCGQCTPCREGNKHMRILLNKIAQGTQEKGDIDSMKKIAKLMAMSSMCGLGETAQSAFVSALQVFPECFAVK